MISEEAALLRRVEDSLLRATGEVPLLSYFQPKSAAEWLAASERALASGHRCPEAEYPPVPDLSGRRRLLDALAAEVEKLGACVEGELLLARIEEIRLDWALLEGRGGPEVRRLSARRFAYSSAELEEANSLAQEWLKETAIEDEDASCASRAVVNLAEAFRAEILARGVRLRVVETPLLAKAALAEDCLLVRQGLEVEPEEAKRVVVHELDGHFARRSRSLTLEPPLRIGAPESEEDDEGFAVHCEWAARLVTPKRKRELALRFLVALEVRAGAELPDLLTLLGGRCVSRAEALGLALRALRGGGLAREVTYLGSFVRIFLTAEHSPQLLTYLASGRTSVRSFRVLSGSSRLPLP